MYLYKGGMKVTCAGKLSGHAFALYIHEAAAAHRLTGTNTLNITCLARKTTFLESNLPATAVQKGFN